jgi:hypothetical protein
METCKHIVSGIISFHYTKANNSVDGSIDYGTGTCDNLAVIKIGSYTKTVTLP